MHAKAPGWLETVWLLYLFENDQKEAKERYRSFVESVQNKKIKDPSSDIAGGLF